MSDCNITSGNRPSFSQFLQKLVVVAFPDVVCKKKGIVIRQIAEKVDELYQCIAKEAYLGMNKRPYSMLALINQSLVYGSASLKSKIKHANIDGAEKQQYLKYVSKIQPIELEQTQAMYRDVINQFADDTSNSWYHWLKERKPKRNTFALIQILLYGILRPHQDETAADRTLRIKNLLECLLVDYMGMKYMPGETLVNYYRFNWENEPTSTTILSEGTNALIGTVFFISNLLLYSDRDDHTWSDTELPLIEQFLNSIRHSIDREDVHIKYLRQTQTAQVFSAQPYSAEHERRNYRRIDFVPPETLPWSDLSNTPPSRVIIQAPAASGKTSLYQALGTTLMRGSLPISQRKKADQLAQQLGLGHDTDWFVIAMNAQQFIWYWSTYGKEACIDLAEMFFRGNLRHMQVPEEILETCIQSTALEKTKSAHQQNRLIFLFDGFDELADPQIRSAFRNGLSKFASVYKNAHMLLFTRPISYEEQAWLMPIFSQKFSLPPFDKQQLEKRQPVGLLQKQWLDTEFFRQVVTNPLMMTLLCQYPKKPLADIIRIWIHQVIYKEYDSVGRKMLLPSGVNKDQLEQILAQIAWSCCQEIETPDLFAILGNYITKDAIDTYDLCKLKDHQRQVHDLARQIGIISYSEREKNYSFIRLSIQTSLAAEYIRFLLHLNVDPSTIRRLLDALPAQLYREVLLNLLCSEMQPDSLLSELLLTDYAVREWDEPIKETVMNDLLSIRDGIYGSTPVQTSKLKTLDRLFTLIIQPSTKT